MVRKIGVNYGSDKFDYKKLDKYEIPTIEYAGKRAGSVILSQGSYYRRSCTALGSAHFEANRLLYQCSGGCKTLPRNANA